MVDEFAEPHAVHRMLRPGEGRPSEDQDWVPGFLRGFFGTLDRAGIRWVVLRNHEDLPHQVGNDIDLVVHPQDRARIDGLVRTVTRELGLFLLRVHRRVEYDAYDVAASDLGGRLFLEVEVHASCEYRGRVFVDADDLVAHRRRFDGWLWALSPGMEAYALLLHAALHKGELKPKYASRLVALEAREPGELLRIASQHLGRHLGHALATVRTEPQLLALRDDLARAVDRRYRGNLWRRPSSSVRRKIRNSRLRLRPEGLLVVFLGPDGSGKSSTTDLLVDMLSNRPDALPVHRVYLGSGAMVLPTRKFMKWLRARQRGQVKKPKQVRDVRPRPLRGGLHVMADEIVRYWLQVRPRLSPHSIVLADRYAYDVFKVNNETVQRPWFRRLATAIIPTPDVTFFLEGDPAVIAERKQELTVAETIRQQREYRKLARLVPDFRPIDLTVRDDAALRGVALQILHEFAARNGGSPCEAERAG
jgi:thymidylate kinase